MNLSKRWQISLAILLIAFMQTASADVITASKSHFTLELVAESKLSPEQVWQKLLSPEKWWHSDHTYSGDAANLSLEPIAGGHWREDWDGGSILHGTVLNLQPNKLLRLNAAFGPLQALAVEAVWTITLTATESGTTIKFDFIVNGSESSGLDKLANPVNYVKGEALKSLASSSFANASQFLNIDGHKLHVGFWGEIKNNSLPWAVLLSGPIDSWHSDTAWFASLAPTLAKNHRVIAIDRASLVTNQPHSPLGYVHFAVDIAEVFQQLDIREAIVIAFASSNISLQLLLQKPEQRQKIKHAYLIDPDALTAFSSARYADDAKPFKDNLDKYLDYILAAKYTTRVEQKNTNDSNLVKALIADEQDTDWQYFEVLFDARLELNNQANLFKEIAIYDEDLQEGMATIWPKQVPMTIFDTDFELEYIESAETDELKNSLLTWKEDAKRYYQSLVDLHPDSTYIETRSRSHLYPFEHPEKLLDTILQRLN